ncbi:hypothetical protein MRY82_01390 [bacterium]|nr:hypothetical protein [bacterium]
MIKTGLNPFFKQRAFTVLELMMGAIILAVIGTICYSALWGTFRTQQTVDEKSDIQELGTAVVNKVKVDLSQTFHVEATRPITRFKGEDNGNLDKIDFTALVHMPSSDEAKESDQALVSYQIVPNPDNSQLNILQRREVPIIAPQDDADLALADFVDVTDKVVEFSLEYFDGEKHIPSWDITAVAQRNKLPQLIKIKLVLQDDKERQYSFFNTVDLPMWQNLSLEKKATPTPDPNNPNPNPSPTPQGGTD